jgi:hypothetical protein
MTTTNILVLVNEKPIGAIETLTLKESRGNHRLEISRMRMAKERLAETFEKANFHVAAQKYPVHIVVMEDKVETLRATNVWLSGIATAYTTDEWILSEGVEAECEFITGIKTYQSSAE